MPDVLGVAAVLLLVGPAAGAVAASHPSLFRFWSSSREEQLRLAAAHRVAWTMLNAGFLGATVSTAAGLAVLAVGLDDGTSRGPIVGAITVVYSMAGTLWCGVVTIRAAATPFIADAAAAGESTGMADRTLGVALTTLFDAFTIVASIALVALGVTLAVGGGVALSIAVVVTALAAVVPAVYLRTGDVMPAAVYLPTMVIGVALLAGWR